ncbi:hypothetical protein Agub_g8906 [Astrephomene gubernaculifera]|uniref:ABC1 atypical kinase-like domain-containing protein n=1 Tax=Astrephomene gubernaculifera TaxID=47775 RepID=A0AAD3HNJ8_9CHLO|nr:hypothetical protein Agub_g8906 [Astrephomene gubernaculifera]
MSPKERPSIGAQQIRALEPCKRWPKPQAGSIIQSLSSEDHAAGFGRCCPRQTVDVKAIKDATDESGFRVRFPVGLWLAATSSGMPDLRIELVRLQWGPCTGTAGFERPHRTSQPSGNLCTHHRGSCSSGSHGCATAASSNASVEAANGSIKDAVSSQCHTPAKDCGSNHDRCCGSSKHGCSSQATAATASTRLFTPLLPYLSTAGALLLLSVLHRDLVQSATATLGSSLTQPGASTVAAVAAAATAVAVTATIQNRSCSSHAAVQPAAAAAPAVAAVNGEAAGWGPGCGKAPVVRPSATAMASMSLEAGVKEAGAKRVGLGRRMAGSARRRLGGVAGGVGRAVGCASELFQRLAVSSTLLSLSGLIWRCLHASSAALAEAVVDLLTVGLSYNCLAREAQLGRLPPGRSREMAWRRRHKAAAQRLARHLADLPPQPPLAPALAALQSCSIAAGVAVDGMPLYGALDCLTAYGTRGGDVAGGIAGGGVGGGSGGSAAGHDNMRVHKDRGGDGGYVPPGGGGSSSGPGGGCKLLLRMSYRHRRRRPQRLEEPGARGAMLRHVATRDPAGMAGIAGIDPDALAAGGEDTGSMAGGVVARVHATMAAAVASPPSTPIATAAVPIVAATNAAATQSGTRAGTAPQPGSSNHPTRPAIPELLRTAVSVPIVPPTASSAPAASPLPPSSSTCSTFSSASTSSTSSSSTSAAALRGLPRAASASSLGATAAHPPSQTSVPVILTPSPLAPPPPPQQQLFSSSSAQRVQSAVANLQERQQQQPPASTRTSTTGIHHHNSYIGIQPPLQRSPELPQASATLPQQPLPGLDAAADGGSSGGSGGGGITGAMGFELHNLSAARAAELLQQEQAEVEALGLPLYGRADHVHLAELDRPMGLNERLGLACRASYLLIVFLPFLTIGVVLLLLSVAFNRRCAAGGTGTSTLSGTDAGDELPVGVSSSTAGNAADGSAGSRVTSRDPHADDRSGSRGGRGSSGGSGSSGGRCSRWRAGAALGCRRQAWRLLLVGCRSSGPAFIKWGQWAATRVDLFPDDFCEALSQLHDRAPTHSFAFTRRQIERSFGVPLETMFESLDPRPVASGSIAQVHRALMRCSDGTPVMAAVKVVHPRVALRIRQDFTLLRPLAAAAGRLPSLRSLSLPETVAQFSCTMTAQADLRVEAAHLRRFHANFARVASQVTTPRPLPGLVRPEVLVETWEAGVSLTSLIRPSPAPSAASCAPTTAPSAASHPPSVSTSTSTSAPSSPSPLNTTVVCLGVDTYLQMLLQDNFVHTDLHPGNIMVRLVGPDGRPQPLTKHPQQPHSHTPGRLQGASISGGSSSGVGSGCNAVSGPAAAAPAPAIAAATSSPAVQLVLLDFGLAEELTPSVRHHFISFLQHLMRGDGASAASHILRWTSRPQACPDPAAFTAAMASLAARACNVHSAAGIDLDGVMKVVLRLARLHGVTIDSCYASLVIAVCVIVGFATSLDPGVNLADAAVPALLAHALTGRVMGRLHL